MKNIRLAAKDGQIVPPPIETFAFAFVHGAVVASHNGVEIKASDALLMLIQTVHRMIADDELRTSAAISEPGSMR